MAKINELKERICSLKLSDKALNSFTEKTHRTYIGTALRYLKEQFPYQYSDIERGGLNLDYYCTILQGVACQIAQSLGSDKAYAARKTSDSWRQVRISLAHMYRAFGLHDEAKIIGSVDNPAPFADRKKRPRASKRMKSIDKETLHLLMEDRRACGDMDSFYMLRIMEEFGNRPCELGGLEIVKSNLDERLLSVKIAGSKNTSLGKENKSYQRGVDRIIENVPYCIELDRGIYHWSVLSKKGALKKSINNARGRIIRAAESIIEGEEKHFCLYTLRYLIGSKLKHQFSDDINGAKKVAAMLGQKNTTSSSRYGNTNTGKSLRGWKNTAQPSAESVKSVKDDRSKVRKRESQIDVAERIMLSKIKRLNKNTKLSPEQRREKIKQIYREYHKVRDGENNEPSGP